MLMIQQTLMPYINWLQLARRNKIECGLNLEAKIGAPVANGRRHS